MNEEHLYLLKEFRRRFSGFQNQYIIETGLEVADPQWPILLEELIALNNNLSDWESENV